MPSHREIAFGAHTDTSFISIGLCSEDPGLEILDRKTKKWICPEIIRKKYEKKCTKKEFLPSTGTEKIQNKGANENKDRNKNEIDEEIDSLDTSGLAVVFIGDFLQVISGVKYRATPHRVRCVRSVRDNSVFGNKIQNADPSPYRVSCPFLVRGRHDAIIDIRNEKYHHQNVSLRNITEEVEEEEEVEMGVEEREEKEGKVDKKEEKNKKDDANEIESQSKNNIKNEIEGENETELADKNKKANENQNDFNCVIPDLDGTSMRFLHKLLDMKRKRCAKLHEDAEIGEDWILSAFPVE